MIFHISGRSECGAVPPGMFTPLIFSTRPGRHNTRMSGTYCTFCRTLLAIADFLPRKLAVYAGAHGVDPYTFLFFSFVFWILLFPCARGVSVDPHSEEFRRERTRIKEA